MKEENLNVSTDEAINGVKTFLREMAQPLDTVHSISPSVVVYVAFLYFCECCVTCMLLTVTSKESQLGITLWSAEHLARKQMEVANATTVLGKRPEPGE